jgi:hypothetical protein
MNWLLVFVPVTVALEFLLTRTNSTRRSLIADRLDNPREGGAMRTFDPGGCPSSEPEPVPSDSGTPASMAASGGHEDGPNRSRHAVRIASRDVMPSRSAVSRRA